MAPGALLRCKPPAPGTVYRDGAQLISYLTRVLHLKIFSINFRRFPGAAGIAGAYKDNTWMAGFPCMMELLRL